MKPMLGIIIPLPMEAVFIAGFKGWHRQNNRKIKTIRLDSGFDLTYICSGMGAENAEHASQYLIARGVSALGVLGVSGGVNPTLNNGDLLVPDRLIRFDDPYHTVVEASITDNLTSLLTQAGIRSHRGALFSHTKPHLTVQEKSALFSRYGVNAVDMESAFVLKAAKDAHLPFFAMRVIGDTADVDIPPQIFQIVDDFGSLRLRFLMRSLFHRPLLIIELVSLGYCFFRSLFILNKAWQAIVNRELPFDITQIGNDRSLDSL